MLLFLITCSFSFILFYKSLTLNPLPSWTCEMRLFFLCFWKNLSLNISSFSSRMSIKKKNLTPKVESVEMASEMSVLDLPDLVLECILEKLPPDGLCRMASVCTTLRDKCISDHLWEKHMKSKWGKIVGPSAYQEWQCHIASRKGSIFCKKRGLMGYLVNLWPIVLIRSSFSNFVIKKTSFSPVDSVMSWYLALESGKFWFPAQVYNRELQNGHVGFMLSCYDAVLSYDRRTDTFLARYPAHGTRASAIESGVTWDRLRAPPVDTSPHDLHVSDCLNDLQPGDQIEIQWRRNKEFPYGWWYGVVGHLETCDGDANYCRCHDSDTLVLEFNQYTRGSRWRRTIVSRKEHREEGNEADGFYGGIRKLCSNEEISMWRKLWPAEVFE
ncbi:hypothetical protein DH2020_020911 [Rehmannia glutinosa]|uniref:F-box domain-containing protein n=1 Tax=Rehmannia glutinosa TaxID=99300 RepID=A0ABR0WBV3_REHGL